ncbi:type I glyceraldehyde-3-phosphate dehydrogenase [Aliarcobacter cryaerophilus]|jgi:glyceraldehyde 3-phosphate dehydrogenase|uniref:Glyceraldehyde-3-phosphate dehydrogenase n=5 Tax=Arcobacteraceae TaxID=2808963 RepID=A0AA96IID8_9BACT|nr:type I glyceraldehyde-3-phosphate dehydrogenase [Aliarcobacter cryaerophilus]WNL12157.1 type I glyceraldehyde-3-phosphate dehydrogenase [Arcobacter sp. AZ-2023]WPD10772.1 type I glyceraldehyde-3-phosphate dehydrogenase [Arcobacter sp. DSM 115954]WPD12787.1 type I glyceraldehyde-3-phosphate dehydrogenase [Arcobacter sp. DSM 115960]MCT7466673.1 type I glyceraldehyde-3-phosphate dehydrogenase [Aliarcobacter cryaerophilus]MCT7472123.1 type I glyceraldehyde-3-phosphate dehydrogenase [Aliarcobact
MAIKVAINGFGRIGRCVARIIATRSDIELVAINDTAEASMLEYITKYDTVHGTFEGDVKVENGFLKMGKINAKLYSTRDAKELSFAKDCGAEIVLECTGAYLTQDKCQVHIDNGAKKVVMSAPAKDDTKTFVVGVNESTYNGEKIISNASCTTNCLGPIAKIIDDAFGIEKGLMTTIHSYTNDQNILDVKHKSDKRRARAGAANMIPTSTGAAKAMKLIMPQLDGKLHGQSVRVPTPNVSMVDVNFLIKKDTTKEEINALFTQKSKELSGIVAVDNDMLVSSDLIGNTNSTIIASDLTQVIGGNMIKVMSWYDNEWGYSARLVDLAIYVAKK